ncbi:hypothetical protein DPEC_G00296680 [Dallia pectoralis]|uniref:Uncharacterized protein n=1 Tax=Dallia pectoralis TaxID=75939 RepID=A0ACC2FFN9_DALPE|nr:hypothetical protein DPEC_G00296680 [Dallia pectoralis]
MHNHLITVEPLTGTNRMHFNALHALVVFFICASLTYGSATLHNANESTTMSSNPGSTTAQSSHTNRSEPSLKPTKAIPPPKTSSGVSTTAAITNPNITNPNIPRTTSSPSGPSFHLGSFLGGMLLAFLITMAVIIGYKVFCDRRDVRYHTLA